MKMYNPVNAVVGETNDGYLMIYAGSMLPRTMCLPVTTGQNGYVKERLCGCRHGHGMFWIQRRYSNIFAYAAGQPGEVIRWVIWCKAILAGYCKSMVCPWEKSGATFAFSNQLLNNVDSSCMIVVTTNAPLDARNLQRLA